MGGHADPNGYGSKPVRSRPDYRSTSFNLKAIESLGLGPTELAQRGYAIDEAEQEIGVRCFAVPVPQAPTPTAISVSGPAARVTPESADRIVPLLTRVAKELSTEFDTRAAL